MTTAHHVGFFRKGDARSWFKMDVTKFGRIYDWFEELEWFPWCKGYHQQPAADEGVECPMSGKVAFGIAGLAPLPAAWRGCLNNTYAASLSSSKPPLLPMSVSVNVEKASVENDTVDTVMEDVAMEDIEKGTFEAAGMVGIPDTIEIVQVKVL